ncbi:fatty acid synthase [Coemansia reversa NRRL 1564]|uniref:Fatty acid synthase n=1 Tax=Coemansia reversa (strain ATCC 12441 / NRRL 1564) TaxID=763665 RepID=A0A2G5BLD0_COERN|nr:fatty acid synthase [Coemansia reversa NRRL 1564]|eukprot:PIA19567.1 fatty acid synthase [Coemansia reversa NRRL 1564]
MENHSIVINGNSVSIEIAVVPELAIQLQKLAYSFSDSSSVTSPIELYALFLEHCAANNQKAALFVLETLCQAYGIPVTNIHVVVQQHALGENAAQLVLRAYYSLWSVAAARRFYRNAKPTLPPVLFATDSLRLKAMFGGQPGSSSYLAEARCLLDIYRPLLTDYVTHLSTFLESQLRDARLAPAYKEGLDVLQWLTHPKSTPDSEYLVSAPISMPLTGLVQLMQITVLYKTLNVSPGDLARYFNAVAGHSQGIAIAVVFSMLSDEQSLFRLSEKVLGILMLIGVYSQIHQPSYYFANRTAKPPTENNAEPAPPRPMVYVHGTDKNKLEALLLDFNNSQPSKDKHVNLAVVNSYDQFVVSATVKSAVKLVEPLRSRSAKPDKDQSKVPFNKRKPVITTSYLNITVPYHCSLLEEVIPLAYKIAQEKQWTLATSDMRLPVCAGDDGRDICSEKDLTRYIIESICVLPVNWPQMIAAHKTTHIVDFGVGGFSGFGQLAYKNVEGRGIPVICAGALVVQSSHAHLGTKADLYQSDMDGITSVPNWLEDFGPKLVRTAHDNKVHINTRMQQMLGMPTVMVAGMNPTTGNESFVAAITNAGYHAELAGGNIHTESDMIKRSTALAALVGPGQGITLNCLYINPQQWDFQYPALRRMRRENLPIVGLCIGGGVPSFEKALEIISELRADGFRHVSFKPGTADSIHWVIQIAKACSGFPILLQWTGGRAGGHHSFEDFHQPILETYAAIRSCKNVALVAGSGFGDVEGTLPYITGDWSQRFGRALMPFDGILLGSRVMVAKEAATSLGAKQLITATAGLSDAEWDTTYESPRNGMTTFESEYGELNHMLDTRAVRFVQDIHKTVLSKPRSEQPSLLLARKDEIIARLNSDYMRPWFGKKADGQVVDLHDMTYAEVVSRAVELMYVKHQQRWTNMTYQRFVVDLIERIESRMCSIVPTTSLATELNKADPLGFHARLVEAYPATQTQLIMSEDVQFFLALCKRRGQKPVPFIPVLDLDFGVLLLKDTLWQSEDLDSVVDQDPQRVYIQQGPVAAQYSTKVDEPVKDILDDIYHGHIAALVERLYSGNESDIPVVQYVEAEPIAVALPDSIAIQISETKRLYKLPSKDIDLPKLDAWLQALAGPQQSWLRALLTAPIIVEGTKYVNNYVRRLLRPRSGRTVAVCMTGSIPLSLAVTGPDGVVELELALERKSAVVLTICHRSLLDIPHQLRLELTYHPAYPLAPIHADKEDGNAEKRRFSARVWAANQSAQASYDDVASPSVSLQSEELVITEDFIRKFCQNIGDRSWVYATKQDERLQAPMEFLYLSSMRDMTRVLASSLYGPGQLDLVHSSNRIELMDDAPALFTGDTIHTSFSVTGLYNTVSGKVLTLSSTTYCNDRPVAKIRSTIHGRGYYVEHSRAFRHVQGEKFSIMLFTDADVAVLESKQWFMYREDTAHQIESNMQLYFCLDSQYRYMNKDMYSSILTTGTVMARTQAGGYSHIANVDFEWGTADINPVTEYLEQHLVDTDTNLFENNGYSLTASVNADILQITAPSTNLEYAKLSGDGNPIHFNPYLADLGEHPGTICHGLWTSASTRAILECVAADGEPERIRAYQVEFVGGVLPNDTIRTNFAHVGMRDGRMLIKGQTSKTDGEPVMIVEAEIDQLRTAYVFTGQGSQEVNMGMELYEQSPAAKSIWNRANSHMFATYGIDLLNIVRTNPTERTVHFNGRIGEQVRSNYLRFLMSTLAPDADGCRKSARCLIPGLTEQSTRYTFRSDTGLLHLTQFTQVALVTVAVAAVADMRSKSLIQKSAAIAGHSLGELCALGALGDIFKIEDLLDIVFCRGMIMQSAIPRDARGRSDFGMAAVNPSRVSAAFDESRLLEVVGEINSASPGLLEIVNYNVRGHQYVAAGSLTNLDILRVVLDNIASNSTTVYEEISACVGRAVREVPAVPAGTRQTKGKATTPLGGIDVPFHSRLFADSVAVFREVVRAKLKLDGHSLAPLYGRYIPNLTAVPFEVSREYFELVYEITGSPVASEVLCEWEDAILADSAAKSQLAATLLVELLAYQIASPVQWIKTQDHLLGAFDVQRVVEIGPSAVLCGMASRTLRASVFEDMEVSLLHADRDKDAVYYLYQDKAENTETSGAADADSSVVKSSLALTSQDPEPVTETEANSSGPIADVPLQALEVVQAIVAFKMKKALDDTSAHQNIKALATGKSTLQNEVVGNLQKEFGNRVPDKPELLSLRELAAAIGTSDIVLGTCTQPLIARLFSNKMPGGFSLTQVRDTLQSTYGLGPQRQDALLLVALTMSPTARLTGDSDASAWLDRVAKVYALRAGITYPTAADAAKSSGISQGPAISGAEIKRIRQEQHEHIRQQIEVLARYSGIDLRKDARVSEGLQSASSELQSRLNGLFAELGDELAEGIQPCFDALKARRFDSYWNWVRQDVYEWIQELVKAGFAGTADIGIKEARIHRLVNCVDTGLLQLLSGTVRILRASSDTALEPVLQFVEELHKRCKRKLGQQPLYRELSRTMYPHTTIAADGSVNYSESLRKDEPSLVEFIDHMRAPDSSGALPLHYLYDRANTGTPWSYSQEMSSMYYDCMYDIHNNGLSFAGKAALVTGCGAGSIGAEIVRGLLMGGAKVVATSSSYSRRTTLFFENMYREYGSSGSELVVVPFNQASVLDVDNLIGFIYGSPKDAGLGWDLDYVFPFAAVTDIGSMATNLGSHSELALRVMMTNVMRLIGRIKVAKEELNIVGRPAIVMLPLSPNHGITGGDGFYSESKIALMTASNRWESESWEGYLSVVGMKLGWTRGTGLMSANNIYGELMERVGVRTFSTWEMTFIIFGLLHPRMVNLAYRHPVYANFDGALGRLEALSKHLASERHRIEHESTIRRAMAQDRHADASLMYGQVVSVVQAAQGMTPLAKFRSHMPAVKDYDSLQHLHHLQGMVNLDKIVVITGYGEVSPHGNAETRWEIEAFSELSVEGCIELAWIMGLIRHVNGPLPSTGQHYTGWVDAKSGEPVSDSNIKSRYEEYILAHTGIRLIEPELADGYDPNKKNVLREVQINQDMEPFEASAEEAAAYKESNGKHVDIWENSSGGSWSVRFLRGALIRVPMSINADRLVAALVPTGWDAARFGITEDLIRQTDMVTLFTLVAAVEALIRSGITDPYELYQHFHVSEVGNTIGSAVGGLQGWDEIFHYRRLHKDVRVDAIQEGMISTIQAWVNMLLMSASGPVKPTVGACATAVLSIDVAVETIQTGKAKVMLAGGVDDFNEVSTAEFASMGASSNTAQEFARGRTTSEMCRPCTTTRCGLVESHGSAVVVLMSASAALKCGAPIYGIVGMSNTATDKQGSSVPAPGKGILTSAREIHNGNNISDSSSLDLLNLDYRRGQLDFQQQMLDAWKQSKLDMLQKSGDSANNGECHANIVNDSNKIERMWLRQKQAMQDVWGNEFWKQDSEISPLRGSLAVWGLTPDDIGLASFHGTSTKANDLNESEVLNAQLAHVGRTPGHVIPVVCQKWMTGHPKGSAAGFMLNGVIQSLRTGIIPGNRNADNIANELWKCDYALYLSKSIQTTGIKSALLKSFGFGQVGGELLVVHPDYILATVDRSTLDEYNRQLQLRITKSDRYWQDVLIGDHPFVQFKTSPPYTIEQQQDVYLNPLARTRYDSKSEKYLF